MSAAGRSLNLGPRAGAAAGVEQTWVGAEAPCCTCVVLRVPLATPPDSRYPGLTNAHSQAVGVVPYRGAAICGPVGAVECRGGAILRQGRAQGFQLSTAAKQKRAASYIVCDIVGTRRTLAAPSNACKMKSQGGQEGVAAGGRRRCHGHADVPVDAHKALVPAVAAYAMTPRAFRVGGSMGGTVSRPHGKLLSVRHHRGPRLRSPPRAPASHSNNRLSSSTGDQLRGRRRHRAAAVGLLPLRGPSRFLEANRHHLHSRTRCADTAGQARKRRSRHPRQCHMASSKVGQAGPASMVKHIQSLP